MSTGQPPQNPWSTGKTGGDAPTPYQSPPTRRGLSPWIWAMLGCAGFFILLIPILAAILFPVFAQAREKARQASCMSNLKQQSLGLLMYAQDNNERLPPPHKWMDLSDPYIKNEKLFHCPSVATNDPSKYGYALNDKLSQKKMDTLADPESVTLAYDSTATGRNAHDSATSLPPAGRHSKGNNIAYADGHVTWKKVNQAP